MKLFLSPVLGERVLILFMWC